MDTLGPYEITSLLGRGGMGEATRMGAIMGTAGYMPPEQAKGKTVDKRVAIWAFGLGAESPCLDMYLSSDHDPLYRFQQWQANLRDLEMTEIKTVPTSRSPIPLSTG